MRAGTRRPGPDGRVCSYPYDGGMQVHEFAEPIVPEGPGAVGVLFLHGFTASPWTLREWAKRTAAAGHRVSVPRLPGHGTAWRELEVTDGRDWYAAAERAFLDLRAVCPVVFVAGLSLGGALALRLAEHHPDEVRGLILVNPALHGNPELALVPLAKHLVRTTSTIGSSINKPDVTEHAYPRTPLRAVHAMLRLWGDVRARLDLVYCPVLLFRSAVDRVVPGTSADTVVKQVSSDEVVEVVLHRSDHVAPLDHDAELIIGGTLDFVARHGAS
ncbi:alpha/beta hydrolase [Micropruina sp.]|uniref:alpha/beta hydrolase n=1 Tax=Micropruina sp. TaxID=2737536 RepID=UPI0039E6EEEB